MPSGGAQTRRRKKIGGGYKFRAKKFCGELSENVCACRRSARRAKPASRRDAARPCRAGARRSAPGASPPHSAAFFAETFLRRKFLL